jgi:hypothetical protein
MQAVLHGELTPRFPVGKLNKQNVTVGTTELLLNALGGQEAASKERFLPHQRQYTFLCNLLSSIFT